MRRESLVMAAVLLLVANSAFGNEKKKPVLPAYRVNARTAVVLIDPECGIFRPRLHWQTRPRKKTWKRPWQNGAD